MSQEIINDQQETEKSIPYNKQGKINKKEYSLAPVLSQ